VRIASGWLTVGLAASGCSLTTDLDELNGGTSTPSDAGTDAGGPLIGPSCGEGLVCVTPPPLGWKFVTLGPEEADACPSGYTAGSKAVEAPHVDPFSCTCTCQPNGQPTCQTGAPADLSLGSDLACTNGAALSIDTSGLCQNGSFSFAASDHAKLVVPSGVGDCAATVVSDIPPVTYAGKWSTCTVQVDPLTESCSDGAVCARQVPSPYTVCVAADGAQECPPAYPHAHPLASHVNDARECSNCSCSATASCVQSQLVFYKMDYCSGSVVATAGADGTCDAISATMQTAASYRYTGTATEGSCIVSTDSVASGDAYPDEPRTVCCP